MDLIKAKLGKTDYNRVILIKYEKPGFLLLYDNNN